MKVEGDAALKEKLDKIGPDAAEAAVLALKRSGDAIMGESMKECPRGATGNLEGSAFVEQSEGGLSVFLGYRAEHAVFVHEMLDPTALGNPVNWTKPGSKNKFLEDPFNRHKEKIPAYVAMRVSKAISGEKGGDA